MRAPRVRSPELSERAPDAYEQVLDALPRDDPDRDLRVRETRPSAAESPRAGTDARTGDAHLGDAILGRFPAELVHRAAARSAEIKRVEAADAGGLGNAPKIPQLALAARQEALA